MQQGQLGVLLGARHQRDLMMQHRPLARLAAAVLVKHGFQDRTRIRQTTGPAHAVGQSEAQAAISRGNGQRPLQHRHRPLGAVQLLLADRQGLARTGDHRLGVVEMSAAVRKRPHQSLPALAIAVQLSQQQPKLVGGRVFGQGAFQRSHRPVALAGRHVGAGQLRRGLAPLGRIAQRHPLLQPLGGQQGLARSDAQTGQVVERRRAVFQHDHPFPGRDGAHAIAERGLGQRRHLSPKMSGPRTFAHSLQLARLGGQDVGPLAISSTPAQQAAQAGQCGRVARQFLQVGEQRLESAGASLDHFTHAGDLQAQRQTCFAVGKQVQLPTAQGDQLGKLLRLLVQAGQGRHGFAVAGLLLDNVPVHITRHRLVRLDGDLTHACAQALAVLSRQRQPTCIEQQVNRLAQVGLVLASNQRADQAIDRAQDRRGRRKLTLDRATLAEKLGRPIIEPCQAPARDLHVTQHAAGQIRGLRHHI